MAWRNAKSIVQFRREVDALRPGRSRRADGTIGDADHQSRTSDHNPWVPPPNGGVVTAIDITDDNGTLTMEVAEKLRKSRDPRIKYVIGERKMFSSYATSKYPAWTWRPYSGPNAHTTHMHLSVQPYNYDDDRPWGLANDPEDDVEALVKLIQEAINKAGYDAGPVDGVPGDKTLGGLTDALRSPLEGDELAVLRSFAAYLADQGPDSIGESFARQLLAFHREERAGIQERLAELEKRPACCCTS